MLYSFALCLLVLTVIILLFAKSFVRSLKQLAEVSRKLADGQMDVDIDVRTNDEIGELAKSTQSIVDWLKIYMAYIDEISDVLNEISAGNLVFSLHQDYVGEFAKI